MTWRVGDHYQIHVYEDDRPVATFHTVADAQRAVEAVNREELLAQAVYLLTHAQSIVEQSGRSTFASKIQDWLRAYA